MVLLVGAPDPTAAGRWCRSALQTEEATALMRTVATAPFDGRRVELWLTGIAKALTARRSRWFWERLARGDTRWPYAHSL
jgi:hypothetical protein